MAPTCTRRTKRPPQNVLMLTDGSDQANRKAEWVIVFSDLPRTTIHWIEVLDCLDSGVITRKRTEIDALHGVPHEALLDYVKTNAIDRIVMSVSKPIDLNRSFVGRTFAKVDCVTTVPVKIIGRTSDSHKSQCEVDLIEVVQRT